jgi:hypothetical protein
MTFPYFVAEAGPCSDLVEVEETVPVEEGFEAVRDDESGGIGFDDGGTPHPVAGTERLHPVEPRIGRPSCQYSC